MDFEEEVGIGIEEDAAPPRQTGLGFAFRKPDALDPVESAPSPTFTPAKPVEPETTTLTRTEPKTPNALQIMYLHKHPDAAGDFDDKFGPGSSARHLAKEASEPNEQQKQRLARPEITDKHVIRSISADEKGDLPDHMKAYVGRVTDKERVAREEAASQSLVKMQQTGGDALKGWDHEQEVQKAEALREAWELKLAQSELMGDDRKIAQRGLRAAETRERVARELLDEKRGGEKKTVGNERARMLVATVVAYQEDQVSSAERALELARESATPADPAFQGVLAIENATIELEQQKAILNYLKETDKKQRQTGSVDDAWAAGEGLRGFLRGAIGDVPGLLGHQLEWMSRNLDAIEKKKSDPEGTLINVAAKATGALAKSLKEWSEFVDQKMPKPVGPDSMFKVESANDLKFWMANSVGRAFGTSAGIMLPAALLGPTSGFTIGVMMGQGELKENIEREFAARGKEIGLNELNGYVATYGTAMGLLDAVGGLLMLGNVTGAVKNTAKQTLIRSITRAAIKGKIEEGITEALQESILIYATDQAVRGGLDPSKTTEYVKRVVEAAVVGGLVGGTMGSVGGAREYAANRNRAELAAIHKQVIEDLKLETEQENKEAATPAKPQPDTAAPRVEINPETGRPMEMAQATKPIPVPDKEARPVRAVDAASFLRERGGIKDVDGELANMGAPKSLINEKSGLDPDMARELLVEAGYITESQGEAITTTEDLYDVLRRVASGERVVPVGEEIADQQASINAIDLKLEENAQILREISGQLEEDGIPYALTDLEERMVVEKVRDGSAFDPLDAYEQTLRQRYDETNGRSGARRKGAVAQDTSLPFPAIGDGDGASGGQGASSTNSGDGRRAGDPAGEITPQNVREFGEYLRGGGSLSRKAYKDLARSSGVLESEVADLLDSAEAAGLVKRDRRGNHRRVPGFEDNAVFSQGEVVAKPSFGKPSAPISITDFAAEVAKLKEAIGKPAKARPDSVDADIIDDNIIFALSGTALDANNKTSRLPAIREELGEFKSSSDATLAILDRLDGIETDGASAADLATLKQSLSDLQEVIESQLQKSYQIDEALDGFIEGISERINAIEERLGDVAHRAANLFDSIDDFSDSVDLRLEALGVDDIDAFWESRETGTDVAVSTPSIYAKLRDPKTFDKNDTITSILDDDSAVLKSEFDALEGHLELLLKTDVSQFTADQVVDVWRKIEPLQSSLDSIEYATKNTDNLITVDLYRSVDEKIEQIRSDLLRPAMEALEEGAENVGDLIDWVDDSASSPDITGAILQNNRRMEARLRAGKAVAISERLQQQMARAIEPTLHMVPENADVGVLTRMEPVGTVEFDGKPDIAVRLNFNDPRGGSFTVNLPWGQVVGLRAALVPKQLSSSGRDAIVQIRSSGSGVSDQLITGGQYHELVHLLRRTGNLDAVFDRLQSHAVTLEVMDMELGGYLGIIGDPTANDTFHGEMVYQAYRKRYKGRSNLKDLLLEESVAHMLELNYHGHYTTEQMAPIADILDMFARGEFGGRPQEAMVSGAADQDAMFAIQNHDRKPTTPGLDMSQEARMSRAKAMGFDTDTRHYRVLRGPLGQNLEYNPATAETKPQWFTDRAVVSNTYAETAHIPNRNEISATIPAFLRGGKVLEIDARGNKFNELPEDSLQGPFKDVDLDTESVVERAKQLGYDVVRFKNIVDQADMEDAPLRSTVTAVINPSNIRSTQAAFDPAHDGSANLMFAIQSLASRNNAVAIDDVLPVMTVPHPRRPILAFHSTAADFREFDLNKSEDIGMHFGTVEQANDRLSARGYGDSNRVIPVVVDVKNPMTMNDLGIWYPYALWQSARRQGIEFSALERELLNADLGELASKRLGKRFEDGDKHFNLHVQEQRKIVKEQYDLLRNKLQAAGYDSIRYLNQHEGEGWSYITWTPNTVRSATDPDQVMFAISGQRRSAGSIAEEIDRKRARFEDLGLNWKEGSRLGPVYYEYKGMSEAASIMQDTQSLRRELRTAEAQDLLSSPKFRGELRRLFEAQPVEDLTLYHGSPAAGEIAANGMFRKPQGSSIELGEGLYFGDAAQSNRYAEAFSSEGRRAEEGATPGVIPVKLRGKFLQEKHISDLLEFAQSKYEPGRVAIQTEDIIKAARDAGFDGATEGTQYVVFPESAGRGVVRNALSDQVMFAMSGRNLPDGQTRVPSPGLDAPKRSTGELIEDLATALNIQLPRTGRLNPGLKAMAGRSGAKLRGQHNSATGTTRLAMATDMEAFSHEAGHALESRYGNSLRQLMRLHQLELEQLAISAGDPLSEGFAEFFRKYITNPTVAENQAPQFMNDFEDFLDAREPQMRASLDEVIVGFQEWIDAPSGGVVSKHVYTAKKPEGIAKVHREIKKNGIRGTASAYMDTAYTALFDDLHPIKRAVDNLITIAEGNLKTSLRRGQKIGVTAAKDAYKLLRLARNSYQAGHIDLMSGVRGYRATKHEGPSFREAVSIAMGGEGKNLWTDENLNRFNAYLVSRRMVQEWQRFQRGELEGFPDSLSLGDHAQAIRDFEAEYPQFIDGAEKLYDYQKRLLKKAYDAGYVLKETYEDLIQRDDYVPVHRHMDDPDGGATPGAVGRTGQGGQIKRFKGSTRDIINPLETISRYTYELNFAIARNDAIKALDALSRAAGPGGGAIVERIPASEMKGVSVDAVEVLKKIAKDQKIDPADTIFMLQAIEETIGEDSDTTIFRAGQINEMGEPIIYFWEDGKRVALRLADGQFGKDMYEAITGLGSEWTGTIVNALALPTQVLRAGVTLDPAFAAANYFRDQLSAWILTSDFGGWLPNILGSAKATGGAARDLFGGNVDDLNVANSMGMIMGGEGVAGLHEARVKREVNRLSRKGIQVREFNPFNRKFWQATGLTETGTRLAVFRNAYRRAQADGLNEYDALVEAAYSANDMIDFGRHGSKMLVARRLVTFLNAALQGMERTARTGTGNTENVRAIRDIISPYIKQRNGQPLTVLERRGIPLAAKMYGKVVMIGMIGAALALIYRDDEEYQEIGQYFRDTHWVFKVAGFDQWLRIPKPFELGAASLIFERGIEAMLNGDDAAVERMLTGLRGLAIPPTSIPGMETMLELATNTQLGIGETVTTAAFKLLTGEKVERRDLVPDNLINLPPEMQYNSYTSEFSKQLGRTLGMSPIKVDHVITGITGSLGRSALNMSSMVLPTDVPKPEMRIEQMIFFSRFTLDPVRSSQSKSQFWDFMGRSNGAYMGSAGALKQLYDQGRENGPEADAYLKSLDENKRAYAMLDLYGSASDRRRHPMNRANAVLGVTNGIRRELATGELRKQDGSVYSPRELRHIHEAIESIQMREARNALTVVGEKGAAHFRILDVEPSMKELESRVPDLFAEMQFRLRKAKVQDFEMIREMWPEFKKELLDPDYRLVRTPARKRGRRAP